ncbi:baseplate J/gp47 family protein [Marinomonas transparens]|uniref:Baseplate J/gp47 family protein n=1 Tax=Marinomonas transparens TaxID=2795388 RepID=A0A934JRI7_9GAMM|nr:baseplate J/gp47 family protein [Marinomonas transparens]MBJ7536946.1 baseplate J/gp47 family protein [Marinomonas transparens]
MRDFEDVLKDNGVPTTEAEITAEFRTVLAESGSTIANNSDYSPFWRLVSGIATKPVLWLVQLLIKNVMPQFFLKTVGESFIELWGDSYNCPRKQSQFLRGRVVFTRTNTTGAFTVPAGTVVYTDLINNTVYKVMTDLDTVFQDGEAGLIVSVTSERAATAYNLEAGYFSKCDLDGVSVTNPDDWIDQVGADVEAIEAYRARIRNAFNTLTHYHTDGVYKYLISSWVGVREDNIWFQHDAPRGPATANAYILFDLNAPAESYLETINRQISDEGYHGHGDSVIAYKMSETEHDLVTTLYFSDALLSEEKEAKKTVVYNVIYAAFRGNAAYEVTQTAPFSRFSFTNLAGEIYDLVDGIEDIEFSLNSIVSEMSIPVLNSLSVVEG